MDNLMRKLPIGIQTFEGIRKDNYLYVDKTALVWRMANLGKPYFLSRPRRFGKSLLISTFDAYFQGKKELFDGLAIEQLETKWEQHPVLHLDLNAKKYETAADLIAMLNQYLEKWEAIYGNEKKDRSPEERFSYVIEQASLKTGKGVVVLVDEYDKPLLQAITRPKLFADCNHYLTTPGNTAYGSASGWNRKWLIPKANCTKSTPNGLSRHPNGKWYAPAAAHKSCSTSPTRKCRILSYRRWTN